MRVVNELQKTCPKCKQRMKVLIKGVLIRPVIVLDESLDYINKDEMKTLKERAIGQVLECEEYDCFNREKITNETFKIKRKTLAIKV